MAFDPNFSAIWLDMENPALFVGYPKGCDDWSQRTSSKIPELDYLCINCWYYLYTNYKQIMPNKANLTLIIAVVLLGGLIWQTSRIGEEGVPSETVLPMFESNFVEYQAFKKALDETFPYYEPDGLTYKEKIGVYFDEKESEMKDLYEEVVGSIPDLIERERNDGGIFLQAPTNLAVKEDLQKFHRIFPEYRKLVCGLREENWRGGSGRGVQVLSCEIYETEKYTDLLKFYKEQFISKSGPILEEID